MSAFSAVVRRELGEMLGSPLAYVFIVIFLVLSGSLTFYVGGFYESDQADLAIFFSFHPWLYLFLMSALAMRQWAEERKSGSIELLTTLPVSLWTSVLGKFVAAWLLAALALALTFPMVLTVNYLGEPDNGAILTGYLGSWLLAGTYLALGGCMSVLSKSQVIAFILALAVGFLFTVSGAPMLLDAFTEWAPRNVIDVLSSMSLLTRFEAISKGVIDPRDLLFFASLILAWLAATVVLVDLKKAE